LSERSVYQRYFQFLSLDNRTAHDRLVKTCFVDYDREMALVAERMDSGAGEPEILAVARLSKVRLANEAELAVLIEDEFQDLGLGTEMSRRLIEIAKSEKLDRVFVNILAENSSMIDVCRRLAFRFGHPQDGVVEGSLTIAERGGHSTLSPVNSPN
jgi:acetyltransferase